jgi:hypothetical protein
MTGDGRTGWGYDNVQFFRKEALWINRFFVKMDAVFEYERQLLSREMLE